MFLLLQTLHSAAGGYSSPMYYYVQLLVWSGKKIERVGQFGKLKSFSHSKKQVEKLPLPHRPRLVRADSPETTQVNFTLQFSDTAFDFRVVSKEGCMSSVSWAMTLHNVLLKVNTCTKSHFLLPTVSTALHSSVILVNFPRVHIIFNCFVLNKREGC